MTSLRHQNNRYELAIEIKKYFIRFITDVNTLRTGDADLRF